MIKYHYNLIQGTEEWYAARCGLLTASEMDRIITPKTLQLAQNGEMRSHLYELLAQRVTKYVEPHYISDDMLRGQSDEVDAKFIYEKHYEKVTDCGFITNDKWGFTLGYSPDALVNDEGLIEIKGRRQKFQIETILKTAMPDDFKIQVQTGLLVSERKWCDFISYCGGMEMLVLRIYPDENLQGAIIAAATEFHEKIKDSMQIYEAVISRPELRIVPTERRIEQEMHL